MPSDLRDEKETTSVKEIMVAAEAKATIDGVCNVWLDDIGVITNEYCHRYHLAGPNEYGPDRGSELSHYKTVRVRYE